MKAPAAAATAAVSDSTASRLPWQWQWQWRCYHRRLSELHSGGSSLSARRLGCGREYSALRLIASGGGDDEEEQKMHGSRQWQRWRRRDRRRLHLASHKRRLPAVAAESNAVVAAQVRQGGKAKQVGGWGCSSSIHIFIDDGYVFSLGFPVGVRAGQQLCVVGHSPVDLRSAIVLSVRYLSLWCSSRV